MRSCLARTAADDIRAASISVCKHIASAHELMAKAQTIGLYASIQSEISLETLHELLPGKRFAYPLCRSGNHLDFHIVEHANELAPNHYHIPEPISGIHPAIHLEKIDIIFCPGLAFGLDGSRLGRGQGYYDRTLQAYQGLRVGIALDIQIRDSVPHNHHDTMMSHLVSEQGVAPTTHWRE